MTCVNCGGSADKRRARGLCNSCYDKARWRGELDKHPILNQSYVRSSDLLEDWEVIRQDLDPLASRAARVRLGAERLGMKPSSLDKALRRAGI